MILTVGSVALDTIDTPFGSVDGVIGGSAVHFAAAASLFGRVGVVGVVGRDYPMDRMDFLRERGVDLSGLRSEDGASFRWGGRYDYDLNARETTFTELGVFADFRARIPEAHRDARWVFLGNIDPGLQHDVLDQIREPRLVACDTMDYWIERERPALEELLGRIDVLMINDAEARELSDDHNLRRAAAWIVDRGPRWVVVKKGEHGAILFGRDGFFFSPGFPLEEVFDPTGAGDAFAGGVLGYLSRATRLDETTLRRAIVYGCATGAYACEDFGPRRFRSLGLEDVVRRVETFHEMTRFDHERPAAGE